MDQDIFDIKNFRLIQPKNQIKTQGVARHPLQQSAQQGLDLVTFEGEKLQPTEDFGTIFVGEQLKAMAQIRYKQHINQVLEYVSIEIFVQKEDEKKPVKIAEVRQQNIKGGDDINVPFTYKMDQEKGYIIAFYLRYKAKPFINNPASAPIIPENQKTKQFRISPKLPFLIDRSINISLFPTYYLEYSLQARTSSEFLFKTVAFIPEDLFDAQLISINHSGIVCLKPEEKEKIIFKIEIKNSQMNNYKSLLLRGDLQSISVGSIFLEWGMCGTYNSKPEEVPIIRNDLELEFAENPELILKKVTKCRVILSNPMRNLKKVKIYLKDLDMEGIKIVGLENTVLDFTQDFTGKVELGIHLLPHQPGIQCVKGLTFWNDETKKYCNVRNQLSVLIRSQEEPLQFSIHQNKIEEVIDFFADNYENSNQQPQNQSSDSSFQRKPQEQDDIQDFFTDTTITQPPNSIYISNTNQNQKNISQNSQQITGTTTTTNTTTNNNFNNNNNNIGAKVNADSIFDDDLLDFDSTNSQSNQNNNNDNNNLDLL